MDNLGFLDAEAMKGVYRLHFKNDVEQEYRVAARGQRKYTRVALFVVLGLSFALAPFYEAALFRVGPAITPLLRIIEFVVVTPTALAAVIVTYFQIREDVTSALQFVATFGIWTSSLALRRLSLEGSMHYPSSMIGIAVMAIAIFSGFNWYRIALGAATFFILAGLQEYQLDPTPADAWLQINAFAYMALIAVLGAYVNEVGFRLAWLNGRAATLLASTDILTGLSNRVDFNRSFPRAFKQARREKCGIAVALIDIDHFKAINDSYGHQAGDAVLKALGDALLQVARRPLDLRVRYGGEEMVVVWYSTLFEAARQLSESLLIAIRSLKVPLPAEQVVQVTASIGVTWLVPDASSVPDEVLGFADRLMYRAKANGRDRAEIEAYVPRTT